MVRAMSHLFTTTPGGSRAAVNRHPRPAKRERRRRMSAAAIVGTLLKLH